MAQQNEPHNPLEPATAPAKRKRGRPRKDDTAGAESGGRPQRRRHNPPPGTGPGLVGQLVSGTLDGVFDAGFLVTVRASNGHLLQGMVFDSRLCVPISAANDVAPHIKMLKRDEIPAPAPISADSLQQQVPTFSSSVANRGVVNDGDQGSALTTKSPEAAVSETHPIVSKAAPLTVQIPDSQKPGLIGEPKLDSTGKASQSNEAALISASRIYSGNEAAGGLELNPARQTPAANEIATKPNQSASGNETAGRQELHTTSQTLPANETAGGLKAGAASETPSFHETVDVMQLCYAVQAPLAAETAGEPKLDSTGLTPSSIGGTVGDQNLDSPSVISPQLHLPAPIVEPELNMAEIQTDTDQLNSVASAAATEALNSLASSEVLQEIKTSPAGNSNGQMPSSDVI